MKNKQLPIIIVSVLALVAGVLTAWIIRNIQTPGGVSLSSGEQTIQQVAESSESIQNGQIFGSPDESIFKDSAIGYLAAGGVGSDGSHHLLRDGGESQTVALTSSVTDLSLLEGMEVEVWGETFAAQSSGWLLDVGRIKVINTQGVAPNE